MKYIIVIFSFITCFCLSSKAQIEDVFGGTFDISAGIVPVKMQMIDDVSDPIANSGNPKYRRLNETGLMVNLSANIGMNIPLIKKETWSSGVRLGAGLGYFVGEKKLEELNSYIFNLPQYLYFRLARAGSYDYSFLIGYKFGITSLNYHVPLLALELTPINNVGIRLYGSPIGYKYYMQYTNGQLEPVLTFNEFGVSLIALF